jgi:hypothetical protein
MWARRLKKAHSQARKSLAPNDRGFWCELDSCNSSDALLMNVFCYPGTLRSPAVQNMLGVTGKLEPEFGVRARVPLLNHQQDATELDMRLDGLLVEAKLTEGDFQRKPRRLIERYCDLAQVFDLRALLGRSATCDSYQLVRNVLAAHASGCAFCVIVDERRPDLLEAWYAVLRCVQLTDLRVRLKALTWQELAKVLPTKLRAFLEEKYGIR